PRARRPPAGGAAPPLPSPPLPAPRGSPPPPPRFAPPRHTRARARRQLAPAQPPAPASHQPSRAAYHPGGPMTPESLRTPDLRVDGIRTVLREAGPTRAALGGHRAQHQTAALPPQPGELPRAHHPAGRHGR